MKRTIQSTLLFAIVIFAIQACKKSGNQVSPDLPNSEIIQDAKEFFLRDEVQAKPKSSTNYRENAAKMVNWESARVAKMSQGFAVIVPIHYSKTLFLTTNFSSDKMFSLDKITNLVVYKDKEKKYHVEIVTVFPDSFVLKYNSNHFTGILFVENWLGQRLRQYKSNPDGSILYLASNSDGKGNIAKSITTSRQVQTSMVAIICYEIDGYNYSPDDPDGGYAWTESGGCSSMYVPEKVDGEVDNGGGALSASDYVAIGGSTVEPTTIVINSGHNIIGNVNDYFKCFTNIGGTDHTYSVTVCVDQPAPGTRQPWSLRDGPGASSAASNPVDVGHTFLIFTESYGGTTITRNVGFYPRSSVNPLSPSDQGQLNDNSSSDYNISLSITINSAQFFNMLTYVSQGNNSGFLYNLNSNNCTSFALNALQAGDVNLASRIGSWFNGEGYDPGDLGEDIRNMPLASNMTRNTVENSHPNMGNCN